MLQTYAPVFVLDAKEKYWPSTIGDYILNCRVVRVLHGASHTLLRESLATPGDVLAFDAVDGARLDLKTDAEGRKHGMRATAFYPNRLEVYGLERVLRYTAPDGPTGATAGAGDVPTAYDLTYVLWFPYNGTLSSHKSDREYVTIRVRDDRPVAAYFSNHQGGYWKTWDQVSTRDGRLLVYVARSSHALYHLPGAHRRMLGLGDDVIRPGAELYPAAAASGSGQGYTIVNFTHTPRDRPWIASRVGRAAYTDRAMLNDGRLQYPTKACAVTDYAALARTKLGMGAWVGITIGVVVLLLALVVLGTALKKPVISAFATVPGVALGLLWTVLTSTPASATLASYHV